MSFIHLSQLPFFFNYQSLVLFVLFVLFCFVLMFLLIFLIL